MTESKLELDIEEKYCREVFKLYGILALKFKKQGSRGGADRICFCPDNHVFFIEFKSPSGVVSEHQLEFAEMMENLNYNVYFCNSVGNALECTTKELLFCSGVDGNE